MLCISLPEAGPCCPEWSCSTFSPFASAPCLLLTCCLVLVAFPLCFIECWPVNQTFHGLQFVAFSQSLTLWCLEYYFLSRVCVCVALTTPGWKNVAAQLAEPVDRNTPLNKSCLESSFLLTGMLLILPPQLSVCNHLCIMSSSCLLVGLISLDLIF